MLELSFVIISRLWYNILSEYKGVSNMHHPKHSTNHTQIYPQLIIGRVTTLQPNNVRRLDYIKRIGALKVTSKVPTPKQSTVPTPIADVPGVIVTWDYTHTELVDTPLVIESYTEIETQFGAAFVTECLIKEKPFTVLMGGQVLMQQLAKAEDAFPVAATIIKIGKYYTFQ